jgi:thiol-disulfide isomerase/thioredoxin
MMMMKSIVVISLLLLHFGVASCQTGRRIEVEVNGIQDSVLYLVHYYGNSNSIADTALRNTKGRYVFYGDGKLPEGVYILVDEGKSKSYLEFLIGDQQHFGVETDTLDFYGNLRFKNSPVNTTFREYTTFVIAQRKESEALRVERDYIEDSGEALQQATRIEELEEQISKIDQKVKQKQKALIDADPASILAVLLRLQWEPEHPYDLRNGTREDTINAFNYTRNHYWDAIDLSDERYVRTPLFHQKLNNYLAGLVVQHPDTIIKEGERIISQTVAAPELFKFVVWHVVNMTERSNVMGMDKAFVHFASAYYLSGKAWWISDAVKTRMAERVRRLERVLIGTRAPELQMWDTNKVTTSLHRVNAEYLILLFWDYDCGHCKKIMPDIRDYYHKMRDQGVQVFAVGTKTDLDKWKDYIIKNNLDWINVNGGYSINRYDTLYDIMATPVIFLLDKDKNILAKRLDIEQIRDFIKHDMEAKRNTEGMIREE